MTAASDPGLVVVEFSVGFLRGDARVKSVSMREPTVGDQVAAQRAGKSPADQETALVGNLCELTPTEVSSLTLRDYARLQEALVGFTG